MPQINFIFTKTFYKKKKNKNKIFDCIRKSKKNFYFINTDIILENTVKKGTKEVYSFDDTHWTEKAIKNIFDETLFFEEFNF